VSTMSKKSSSYPYPSVQVPSRYQLPIPEIAIPAPAAFVPAASTKISVLNGSAGAGTECAARSPQGARRTRRAGAGRHRHRR
jgi:hypothetical protein